MEKFNRKLLAVALGLAGVVGFSGAAEAQSTDPRCYPVVTSECPAGVVISDTVVTNGEPVTATATGLDPNTAATGTANSTPLALGTKNTLSNGSVSFTFDVPADFEPGAHSVTIVGLKNGASTTLNVGFTVVAAGVTPTTAAGNGSLARTGDDSSLPLTQGGVALLALGGGAVYMAKRRRAATAS